MGNSARRLATLRDAALSQAFRLVRGVMDNLVKIGTLLFLPWVLAALPSIWGGLRAESVVVKIVSGGLLLGAGIVSELTAAHIVSSKTTPPPRMTTPDTNLTTTLSARSPPHMLG